MLNFAKICIYIVEMFQNTLVYGNICYTNYFPSKPNRDWWRPLALLNPIPTGKGPKTLLPCGFQLYLVFSYS